MPNALTRHVGLNAGSWVLETLVKHYFDHLFKASDAAAPPAAHADPSTSHKVPTAGNVNLRREEILYDEAFHIIRSFLDASTYHTVEELQKFSNTRTPSPPWIHVVRLLIPMSCCDEAALLLIQALGGEEWTRKVAGGTKWWQVRGLRGVDAQWIVAKKDHEKAKKQRKEHERMEKEKVKGKDKRSRQPSQSESDTLDDESVYQPEMNQMRCLLYFHGGGYYFGSVDQERYFMQRLARKFGGRLLAVNYRLAPQYPFPCALQDALASYLYLIRPPEGALHTAIDPTHIVVGGDSAGGGLALALLQVIRDTGLPTPAGGILISPWCDLTHSFPSIHLNTESDIIPKYGLALHKPSPLWPPPPDEVTTSVQAGLRSHIKRLVKHYIKQDSQKLSPNDTRNLRPRQNSWRPKLSFREELPCAPSAATSHVSLASTVHPNDIRASAVSSSQDHVLLGDEAPLPTAVDPNSSQTIVLETTTGETLTVRDQVQLYCPNNLLIHPLISPALSYLGGLPPLLIIASDAEVLRDEVLYSAHKAAHPDRYPVKSDARDIYPPLQGIEERYGPTKVHLQVYDEAAHVLPVLFSFTSPAKFCFRAMALFVKYVTGTLPQPQPQPPSPILEQEQLVASPPGTPNLNGTSSMLPHLRRAFSLGGPRRSSSILGKRTSVLVGGSKLANETTKEEAVSGLPLPSTTTAPPPSIAAVAVATQGNDEKVNQDSNRQSSVSSEDSTGPDSINRTSNPFSKRHAGESSVYTESSGDSFAVSTPVTTFSPFVDNMIRERVSMYGEIRPLEPAEELTACRMPSESIGVVAELAIRRYMEGRGKWDEKFASTIKSVAKRRKRNLDMAKKETMRNVTQIQSYFFQNAEDHMNSRNVMADAPGEGGEKKGAVEQFRKTQASWGWAWAIDGNERPPASSIVARRDTEEARRLSKIADLPMNGDERHISGNSLWSYLINTLTKYKA